MKFFKKIISGSDKTLLFIFIISFILRVLYLGSAPYAFHIDEVVSGYIGRFILLNGRDIYGNIFPLFYFNSFGDYRTILPMYINGLSTFIFGVNMFAVRFPSALFGALAVFPVYAISTMLFGKKKFAYIPPLLLAILPWHIVLSRATSEGIFGLTLLLYGIEYLLESITTKSIRFLVISNVLLFITYFTYPSFRLLVPAILLPIPLFVGKNIRNRYVLSLVLFILCTVMIALTPYGRGRYRQTSLFQSQELAGRIYAKNVALSASEGSNNVFVARLFHNKVVGYAQEFTKQYLSYFSPGFLFTEGGLPYRYTVPYVGLLYVSLGILLVGLLLPVAVKISEPLLYYFLYLLFIAPLPSAITIEDVPNIHRAIFFLVPLVLFASIGLLKIVTVIKKSNSKSLFISFTILLVLGITAELIYFVHQYTVIAPSYKSYLRNDGYKELMAYIKSDDVRGKNIILPLHDMPLYYLFSSNNFDKNLTGKFRSGIKISQIDNIQFIDNTCPSIELNRTKQSLINTIVVDEGDCEIKDGYTILTYIIRKDSTKAFYILKPPSIPIN